ncbi:dTDP-4-amino-4,6-dideoxygalactose transaminase [Candidatus Gottesmanbacteria bacterium CG11_big_fil_rev_8_21_14_0_20_37_11]|uniref:dTDP-4-amino-4,6-dideoxygalactose transaminase n=2 Tax=Candidatus Gottesmaniibacteriota TaxID=1752720 RepID=A0A2M7RQT2_9BACT|nr:MAG: dTDP-4-amino-4,6-dideoxygalactose transaminase [Candidatus Gottesmanbacteria bacterium CG11_big_fil_rev_8_21_14_0_20_37_11]PIZ02550.1 MAG: dTDP-4-amino-4,6-dideoxygalactose transaminase [Candidatus Gottesmanbacteria bacterium CG_4_10_14_0_8_um_filter_37_24]
MKYKIPFNRPSFAGKELKYIKQSVYSGKISGDGMFSKMCTDLLVKKLHTKAIYLTSSGTHALDMSAILLNLKPGDEVIVPSFTFTSTANAFVMFGARPKFAEIRSDTLNIDESKIEPLITSKTKAVYCMHYAGVGCEMDKLKEISKKYKLFLVEDAAQALNAKYKNRYLGTIGDIGIYSFHETKNYNCGEGGAIVINNNKFVKRAEIVREKGTDRTKFFKGEINKYTWKDIGSSYLLSDVLAAYLYAQLEHIEEIKRKRKYIFEYYFDNLREYEKKGYLRLPVIPKECETNYHIFYLLFDSNKDRDRMMNNLRKSGILAVFHYLPLHSSPMGKKFGYKKGDLPITESISGRLLRLPIYNDLKLREIEYIVKSIKRLL